MSFCINKKISENSYKTYGMGGNTCYESWSYDADCKILHRMDGPAVMRDELELPGQKTHGHREWWYMGRKIECSSQEEFERLLKLKVFW